MAIGVGGLQLSHVVYAYFDLSTTGGDVFILDDPVKGVLDAGNLLGGDTATDISAYVRSVSIQRGRSRALDDVEVGTCVIELNNHDRRFDPLHASSPYAGNIVPGKRFEVAVTSTIIDEWWTHDHRIFTGFVEDWSYSYDVDGNSIATVTLIDALGLLARMSFDAWTTTDAQSPAARLHAVLNRNEVAFPQNRSFDDGYATLTTDSVTWGSNVLNYLRLVASSEPGRLFADRDGVLTFHDRRHSLDTTSASLWRYFTAGDFVEVEHEYGSELLFNYVGVDREGGTLQTVSDATSMDAYGVRTLALPGLLLDDDDQSLDLATYLLQIYKDPEVRVKRIRVRLGALSDGDRQGYLAITELGDMARVSWTPNGTGDAVDQWCVVEGIEHDIRPDCHDLTLILGSADSRTFFRLDDPVLGVLDSGAVLAF